MDFSLPWRFGANFIPSTAINQLEMWQADTFDEATIDRELGYGASIGMSIMRVYLHDLLWEQDSKGFIARMERYLEIADRHHIVTMFTLFDDCWSSEFSLGKQPAPIPETHNSGWVQSPGNDAADDLSQRPRLEAYVKGILDYFRHDKRIACWDLYNEAGGGSVGEHVHTATGCREIASLPLLKDVFAWGKDVRPDQPLTSCAFAFCESFDEMNRFVIEQSDVVSFHCYTTAACMEERINLLRLMADGRPLVCSEYLARSAGCRFEDCLPLLKKNNVTAINWGLVSGKTQTIYPWKIFKHDPALPFHDVFNTDGTLLMPAEADVFAQVRENK